MKNTILLILATLLIACSQPTEVVSKTTDHVLIVKDSLWSTVYTVQVGVSRSASLESVQSSVDSYNRSHKQDYRRVYIDEAPDMESAPDVDVTATWIGTGNTDKKWVGVPRVYFVDHIDAWKLASPGKEFYVEHVPPEPVSNKELNPYAWYAVTVVDNSTGEKVYDEHCGFLPNQSFDSGGLFEIGEVDLYFFMRLSGFNSAVAAPVEGPDGVIHASCRVVSRQLYITPEALP